MNKEKWTEQDQKQFEEMVKEHRKDYEDSLKEMTDTDIKLAKISDTYCKEQEWIENHTMKCPRCGGLATNQEPNYFNIMVDTKFHCYKCDWDEGLEEENGDDIPLPSMESLKQIFNKNGYDIEEEYYKNQPLKKIRNVKELNELREVIELKKLLTAVGYKELELDTNDISLRLIKDNIIVDAVVSDRLCIYGYVNVSRETIAKDKKLREELANAELVVHMIGKKYHYILDGNIFYKGFK